jgi:hypothetical protein
VTGKTDAAIKAAQQHAQILSGFVARGAEALHETHPVGGETEKPAPRGTKAEAASEPGPGASSDPQGPEDRKRKEAGDATPSSSGCQPCPKCEDSEVRKAREKEESNGPHKTTGCPKGGDACRK